MNTIIIRCVDDEQKEKVAKAYEMLVSSPNVELTTVDDNLAFIKLRKVDYEPSLLHERVFVDDLRLVALSLMRVGYPETLFFDEGKMIDFTEYLLDWYGDEFEVAKAVECKVMRGDILVKRNTAYGIVV